MNIEEKIKYKLTEYLGFNYNEIINDDIDYAYIYGGAIRDIIANKEINDIDILCLPKSKSKIIKIIEQHGYKYLDVIKKDINILYSKINIIIEPVNYIKIINNKIKVIQLIVPVYNKMMGHNNNEQDIINNFHYILGQVDMSNCAVHFSNSFGLRESYLGAINHCKHHVFEILDTKMKTNRFELRYKKFINRGWTELTDNNNKNLIRSNKLDNIINSNINKTKYYLPIHSHQKKLDNNDNIFEI